MQIPSNCQTTSNNHSLWGLFSQCPWIATLYLLLAGLRVVRSEISGAIDEHLIHMYPDDMEEQWGEEDQLLNERWTTAAPDFDPKKLEEERRRHEESLQLCQDLSPSDDVKQNGNELVW